MKKEINFTSFKELKTERLLLRSLKTTDKKEIFFLRSDPEINRYIMRTKTSTIEEALSFIKSRNNDLKENKSFYWAITIKGNPKLIGTICLWNFSEDKKTAELGYELFPAFQGRGIMNEAVKKVIELSFQNMEVETLEAFTHKDNIKSKLLLLKNNFSHDPKRKDEDNTDNLIFVLKKKI
ncbi:MAG TPA: GNAT family N-acetyltransferase [Hanamia sp.]|nr:GNAT family N-acetyltransferase [Hanamia sp.]